MIKLYQYHHCPYCVRADMVANYKNIPHEKIYLLNDDEQSCYDLVNAKMVPIVQLEDGTAFGESLDIVAKFAQMGDSSKIITPAKGTAQIDELLASVKSSIRCLTYPRNIMLDLPEYATQSACDYFRTKKEQMIGMSFAQAMAESEQHSVAVNKILARLPVLPISNTLSMDDVLVFPALRNLSMIKGLIFPPELKNYINHIAALTKTETYFAKAL
jgi:glutaredoxin 2